MDSHRDQSKASISVVVPHSPTVKIMLVLFEKKTHNMAHARIYRHKRIQSSHGQILLSVKF